MNGLRVAALQRQSIDAAWLKEKTAYEEGDLLKKLGFLL